MPRILIIEDDPDIATVIEHAISREEGFEADIAVDGPSGIETARSKGPDLILLDLNLPGMDGLEVCRHLRREDPTGSVPIIMLTARISEVDKIAGLEIGADDYVTKPFSPRELIARIRAVLRRTKAPADQPSLLRWSGLEIDEASRVARVGGRPVHLTRREFDLLVHLMHASGRVLTRDQLLERVWGYDHPGATRTVDVHVRQLRKKLGPDLDGLIETVVGVGYRIPAAPA